jgi:sugar phosphate isomerase/epimerase
MSVAPGLELCWGTVRGTGLIDLIDVAAAAGFPAITITPAHYFEAREGSHSDREIRDRLDDAGVEVSIIDPLVSGLPGVPNPEDVDEILRPFIIYDEGNCFRAAEGVGATRVNLAPFLGELQSLEKMAGAIAPMANRAADCGVGLSIEYIPHTSVPNIGSALALVNEVNAANFGILVDTWHHYRSGGSVKDLAGIAKGAIVGLQINDAGPEALGGSYVPMVDRLWPGEGCLPLTNLLEVLLMSRPGLKVGIEVFSRASRSTNPIEIAQRAHRSLMNVLQELRSEQIN